MSDFDEVITVETRVTDLEASLRRVMCERDAARAEVERLPSDLDTARGENERLRELLPWDGTPPPPWREIAEGLSVKLATAQARADSYLTVVEAARPLIAHAHMSTAPRTPLFEALIAAVDALPKDTTDGEVT